MKTPHTVFQTRRITIVRLLTVSLITVALVSIGHGPGGAAAGSIIIKSASVLQTTVPMLAGQFQVVNDGFGDQMDPHVACDLASYVNDDFFGFRQIRYFDFATNTDHVCH